MSERLVFHHLPKTAGTSLHNELANFFREDTICPERGPSLWRFSNKEMESYRFFSGHYDKFNVDLVPGPKTLITFLREPMSRIVSLYYFWRSHKWDFINASGSEVLRLAKSLPLLDFLSGRQRSIRVNLENALCRTYYGRDNYTRRYGAQDEFFADWALCNIRRYNFVGFMETFDEDVARLRQVLELPQLCPIPTDNRRGEIPENERDSREHPGEMQEITPEIRAALEELTNIDRIFYEKAFAERLTLASPIRIDIRLGSSFGAIASPLPPTGSSIGKNRRNVRSRHSCALPGRRLFVAGSVPTRLIPHSANRTFQEHAEPPWAA